MSHSFDHSGLQHVGAVLPDPVPSLLDRSGLAAGSVTAPIPPASAARAQQADGTCASCGTTVPYNEPECAFCLHARAAPANSYRQVLLHWAVFVAVMGLIFGAGWIATH